MSRTDAFLAAAVPGAAVGWFASLTLADWAQVAAALATAGWMVAQTWVLLFRHRCVKENCPHRISK